MNNDIPSRPYQPSGDARGIAGAMTEILGLGAVALVAMGLLAFGYNTRESNTQTTRGGEMSIQAQQPARNDRVAPDDMTPAPTTFTTGQGDSNGEQKALPR
jgi:hypothetical protein